MTDIQVKIDPLNDLTLIDTGKKTYNQRNKVFQKFCIEKNLKPGIESLNLYLSSEELSVSTKRTTKSAVFCALKKICANNPLALRELEENFKGIKTGKKNSIAVDPNECYTQKEIDSIIKKLNTKKVSPKFNTDPLRYQKLSLMVWVLFNTGLRISEMIGIRIDKIHLNGIAKIKIIGKGEKEREIFLPREKVEEIQKVFKSKTYLFENSNGGKYDRVNLTKLMKREIELVYPGKSFHPHLLRHSFATTQIISKKKSIKSISVYLGHSSTAITNDLYVHDKLSYNDLF